MYPDSYSGTGKFSWRVTVNDTYSVQITFVQFNFDAYDSNVCTYNDRITVNRNLL